LGHKIIAVIDTNLFVSGLFGQNNTTAQLQELWIRQEFHLGTSLEIMKEVARVLQYPKIKQRLLDDDETVRRFFRLVFREAVIARDTFQTDKIVDDPTDNKFLACALETQADYIVSGDNHLLFLKHFQRIQIVDAVTFIKKVDEQRT
jgi:putative PIN family toxin of toxin-antitoxin system